jgi:hypothetical protein
MTNEINITHIKKTTINQITNYSIVEPKLITMKKTFTLIFAFCSFFILAKGQVLLDETFDYSVANLELETTWTTGWTTDIGVGTGLNIVTPALTYITAEGTYVLSDLERPSIVIIQAVHPTILPINHLPQLRLQLQFIYLFC